MYHIGGNTYSIVKDHKNGWNYEVFRERYSEVLDRYDFIVGDWGYNQLRLKGFFKETNNKGAKDSSISLLHDYLNEYCNFGCAYFIIEKLASRKGQPEREDGEEGELEAAERSYEAEKPKDPDFKPRQHYHRSHEPRHRSGGDKSGGPAAAASESPKSKGGQENSRSKDAEPRQRNQEKHHGSDKESRFKNQEQTRNRDRDHNRDNEGRNREGQQQQKAKPHHHNGQQPDKSKGQHPPKNRNSDQPRNKDRDREKSRDRDKEKTGPVV